ncbi:PAS domain S-box protein [Mucilaginibacter limnophilus]|uniref:histidine kinase n=1 Tax=Mucilaginibacter limnophilus TaxID=1932778 RepID=A0A3S2WXJ1_9SPHI|nr:PAS domain S-box protein [Mucilaginibacter limnophilus]RVU00372.1 PAS domain S-box protein [Mucilaginibacter limnophilus]
MSELPLDPVIKSEESTTKPAGITNAADATGHVAICLCDSYGRITYFNQQARQYFTKDPATGTDVWYDLLKISPIPGGDVIDLNHLLVTALESGEPIEGLELTLQLSDSSLREVSIYVTPFFNADGKLTGASNTIIDITEQKQLETRQAMLAAIIESSDDAIISKTLDGTITSWNHAAEKLFGYTEEEIIGKPITTLIPTERLDEEKHIISSVSNNKKVDHFETIRVHKNGHEIQISLTVSPIRNNRGQVVGASKIARSISDKLIADENRATLAAIVDTSDDTIISKTLNGIITSWNKAAERMFGYTREEALGKHISLLIPPERLHEEDIIIGNISKGNRVDHFETIRVAKNGTRIPISLSVSPVLDSKGNIIGASKIARDISKQKNAESQLQQYADNLEILNSVGKMVSESLDIKSILDKVTEATTQLTGAAFGAFFYNEMNSQGESYMLYSLSGAPREAFDKFGMPRNTAIFHSTFSGEKIVRVDDITKDPKYGKSAPHYGMPKGHLPVVSYLAVPVSSKSGSVIGGLFFGHPESGVFTAEHEELIAGVASQAAAALDNARLYEEIQVLNAKKDEFIGLASHELKTPITSISGYLQLINKHMSDGDRNKSFITKTLQQVNKLSALISDLLDVSKIQTGKLPFSFTGFDASLLLRDVTEMMQSTYPSHHIELHTADNILVTADQQRIEQVIINLISNAVKYSPGANKVIIKAEKANEKIRVSVQDFGIGIEKQQHERIFSRFYRVENLAAHMSGLGIGLYICHEIIDRHKGRLWVESEIGKGSTFVFEIPENCY